MSSIDSRRASADHTDTAFGVNAGISTLRSWPCSGGSYSSGTALGRSIMPMKARLEENRS
jgi:hypothetical protein